MAHLEVLRNFESLWWHLELPGICEVLVAVHDPDRHGF